MQRVLQPEILDSLEPTDPVALANRRDIRFLNHLMGNFRWVARVLSQSGCTGGIVELGAGDGSLGVYLAERKKVSCGSYYCGLDLLKRPPCWPANWDWIKGDLRNFHPTEEMRVVLANLILHQFSDCELKLLGRKLKQSGIRWLFINEPLRKRIPLILASACRLIGLHAVTVHDARVSVMAGFRGEEVAELLELDSSEWKICFSESLLGANRVICKRL